MICKIKTTEKAFRILCYHMSLIMARKSYTGSLLGTPVYQLHVMSYSRKLQNLFHKGQHLLYGDVTVVAWLILIHTDFLCVGSLVSTWEFLASDACFRKQKSKDSEHPCASICSLAAEHLGKLLDSSKPKQRPFLHFMYKHSYMHLP